MEDMGIRLHMPGGTSGVNCKVEFTPEAFEYEKEKDCFICPAGKELTLRSLEGSITTSADPTGQTERIARSPPC